MNQQFCAAVQALSSSATTPEQRKAAEAWLLEFQRSEEGWPVALELVASTQPQEVQTFAAQALKRRAWVSRSGDRDLLQRLQNDLLNLMAQSQQIRVQPLRQVVLALVGTIMPLLQGFNQLLQQLAQAVPTHITLLVLETLAEEVACLEPFGPGSSEDRLQAVADIKAGLRSSAAGPLSWLAHVASQHAGGSPTDSATQAVHKQLLCCFQAWVRLGTLHDMSPNDSHSLVSLALTHLEDLNSQAFPAAGEVLAEIMEHCPQEWLPALHDPCMRAAQQAKQAAEEGRTAAAEILCKVVAAYAVLAINIFEPASSPQSSACLEVLMGLAQLPHVAQAHGETADPVAWPALATWTQLAEFLMDVRVGGYEVFDDEEFFGAAPHDGSHAAQQDANGHEPTLTQGNGTQQSEHHAGNGGGAFTTGTDLVKAQEATSVHTSEEVKAIFEKLLCGLLNNLVIWQQKTPTGKSCYVDNFTPTFTATLNDCLGCCCSVIGPQRFTSLLWMLMDRPDSDAAAPLAAAAAMHAVSAAGSLRLTSEPGPLQTLAGCMAKAAAQQQTSTLSASFLVPFCCAAAATSRTCIKAMAQGGADAKAFMNNAFQKALNGLGHADDSLDLHTPAAFTIKQIVTGASEAGLPAPRQMVQALAGVLPKVADTDAAAEQALVVALCMALGILEGGQEAQHNALYETYQSLTGPLHQSLGATQQALQGGRSWADIRASVEEQVVGPLRRYSLLLQHLAPQQQQEEGASTSAAGAAGQKGSQHAEGFNWLAQTFIQQLWPLLSGVLRAHESVSGEFVQPMCRCMTVIIKAQAPGLQDVLQQWLEVLASVMFRPKGRHASEPFCAALAVYGAQERFASLAQQAVSAVLGASRASECKELRSADKDPELAEALLKVASAYMRHVFKAVAAGSAERAEASIAAVAGLCAACSCADCRGVALAALQTVGSVLAAAREPGQAAPHILVAVGKHAALLTTGLMGSLLSLSPLGRVVKVQSLLVDLGGISQALTAQSNGQTHQQQQQPPHEAHLRSWLAAAAAQFQLSQAETESVLNTWPGAVSEALAAERMGAREQQAAGRRLKKLLRDFAELHSRTQ